VPPWFNGAMELILNETMERILNETIAPIRADIQDMKTDIRNMKDDIQEIKRVQGHVWKQASRVFNISPLIPPLMTHWKIHNISTGAGDGASFEVVPFTNGRDPTKDPVSFCLSPTSATS
jgi:hypothetical protein